MLGLWEDKMRNLRKIQPPAQSLKAFEGGKHVQRQIITQKQELSFKQIGSILV